MPHTLLQLKAAFAGRYRIERVLGVGGMASVYLADDIKHARQVAIKVLHEEVAAAQGHERFDREIKIAAGLHHPHIVPLYDSGAVDGMLYFVMPYLSGESLRARLERESRLPVATALRIAYEVADALTHAHAQGVVHRDIKPENILLESGHAIVADFGIAYASPRHSQPDASRLRLTDVGVALGTPAYMSPEQAAADPSLDERSDIYSLGCVLYEMLVGTAPFPGSSWAAIAVQRVSEPPPHASAQRSEVPRTVGDLVVRTMSLAPEDRIATASELADRLDAAIRSVVPSIPGSASRPGERSIAVLSFDNLSPDSANDYFADGVAEDIIDALTQVDGLRVVPRTSAFAFKGQRHDVRTIASQLGVESVLQGSVRRSGDRLRITVQLVNAGDGYQLWSERFERDLTDVFAIQDEIAKAVVLRLRVMMGRPERRLVRPPTKNLEAYEHFVQGRALLARRGRFIREAVARLEAALSLDADFALAHAALAEALTISSFYGAVRPSAVSERAKESASRAVALGPELATSHVAHALCALHYDFDRDAAMASFERARALEPGNADVAGYRMTFMLHLLLGAADQAIREGAEAIKRDPLNGSCLSRLANAYVTAGRAVEAIPFARRAVELDPHSLLSQTALVHALGDGGDAEGAIRVADEALTMSGRHPWMLAFLGNLLEQTGDRAGAIAIHEEAVARSRREYVQSGILAITAANAGSMDDSIAYCHRAIDERDMIVLFFLHPGYPFARRPRKAPRFAEVLSRIGWGKAEIAGA